jgi:hypothetical protein
MRLTRAVLPAMISGGGGALAYVSSEAGLRASISGAGYTTAKHALHGFVKSVAFYYGPLGVRANVVAPGAVNTGMDIAFRSEYAQERTAAAVATATPIVEPEVVTRALLWLLSDDSANVNGVILPTDGGLEHCLSTGSSPRLAQPRLAAQGGTLESCPPPQLAANGLPDARIRYTRVAGFKVYAGSQRHKGVPMPSSGLMSGAVPTRLTTPDSGG